VRLPSRYVGCCRSVAALALRRDEHSHARAAAASIHMRASLHDVGGGVYAQLACGAEPHVLGRIDAKQAGKACPSERAHSLIFLPKLAPQVTLPLIA
jgi:hypothetical protein